MHRGVDEMEFESDTNLTKETQEEWNRVWKSAELLFAEALDLIDEGVRTAISRLPALEAQDRGQERLFRYPEKSVDVALALKLVQLRGNIRAGKLLIDNSHFLEWDVILRSMQDSLEDVSFLVFGERDESEILQKYLDSFFEEDFDKDGVPKERRQGGGVQRPEVREVLERVARKLNITAPTRSFAEISGILHRVRSGSVHGRAASVIRAYLDESTRDPVHLCLDGKHTWNRARHEYEALFMAAAWTVSTFFAAGTNRWWDVDFVRRSLNLSNRMQGLVHNMDRLYRLPNNEGG